jgi:gliding motility-associated-like protein
LFANADTSVTGYEWSPSTGLSCVYCPTPTLTADNDITYTLKASTQLGCIAEKSVTVHVLCNQGAVYIPSAFTPNGDGRNDVFYVMGHGLRNIKSFRVYDRYGHIVFDRQNIQQGDRTQGWNGAVNGTPVSQSTTFVYIVDAVCTDGTPVFLKGTVVLIIY